MKKIVFVTGNKGKAMEAQAILKVPLEVIDLEFDEVQSMDLSYVSRRKTEEAFKAVKRPVITDDVGVFMEAWNGFPGPFAKFILDTLGNKQILKLFKNEKNRKVIVKSAIGYHDGEDVHVFIGEVSAKLSTKEKGTQGWGFDPVIIPDGQALTYAEMGIEGKNKLSHRKKALDKLREFLDSKK